MIVVPDFIWVFGLIILSVMIGFVPYAMYRLTDRLFG